MGPKKKQAPRNPFYFFMIDFKESAEMRGRSFPGGLKDVAEAASPSWKEISPTEKKRYEEKARAWKAEQRGDSAMKYTSTGISFAEVDNKIREEEEYRNFMMKSIQNEVKNVTSKQALESKFFYLIHVNWYCITSNQTYLPAEIGITEFSIKTGVNRVYHTFVNPGPPPTGYRLSAQENINATHQIPIEFEKGDTHFSKMLRDIKNFIKPGGGGSDDDFPFMYTMPDSINHNTSISAVKSTLHMLCENETITTGQNMPVFHIFLLDKLFYELRNACGKYSEDSEHSVFPTTGIPIMELEKEVFSSTYNLACEYHQNIDRGIYCSLSKVKGWAYLICDFCCQDMDIELIPGRHCPELVDRQYLRKRDDYDRQRPVSPGWRQQSPPRKPRRQQDDGWGLPKKEVDGDGWVTHTASERESPLPSVWGAPTSNASRSGSMSSVLFHAPPDFSEQNFPSMGRGRGHYTNRNGNKLSSGIRGMRLNK